MISVKGDEVVGNEAMSHEQGGGESDGVQQADGEEHGNQAPVEPRPRRLYNWD